MCVKLMVKMTSDFYLFPGEYSEREGYKGSEYAPTYEDKDGDWMLVGDVPWE
jgi:auxin-responsive protein IAA